MGRFKLAGVLAALAWMIFGITGVVRWIAGDGGLMGSEMLRTAPPETTGLPESDYAGVGVMTADFLTGKQEVFQYVVARGNGTGQRQNKKNMTKGSALTTLPVILISPIGICWKRIHIPSRMRIMPSRSQTNNRMPMLTKANNMNPNRFIYQKQVQRYKNYSTFANICGIFFAFSRRMY